MQICCDAQHCSHFPEFIAPFADFLRKLTSIIDSQTWGASKRLRITSADARSFQETERLLSRCAMACAAPQERLEYLRVSEACDLRWDDIDLPKRTIIVRRLKGSTDSVHYLERDEVNGLKLLQRQQQANGIKGAYVFINERGQPFGRMGIARMIERAGEAAGLPFPVHVHMLRHSTGYALAARGMDTRRLQHFLGHASITNTVRYTAMSPEPFKDIWR
jgi:integrase